MLNMVALISKSLQFFADITTFFLRSITTYYPIWMTSMESNSEDTCIGSSNSCPSSSLYSCNHNQDFSIECSKTYNSNILCYLTVLF